MSKNVLVSVDFFFTLSPNLAYIFVHFRMPNHIFPIQRGRKQLVSWYFDPSQPQKITSGLKQTSICLLFTMHTNSPKTTKSVTKQIYIKQNIHKQRTQNFRRISPFGIEHIRLGHAGIVDYSVDLSTPDFYFSKV